MNYIFLFLLIASAMLNACNTPSPGLFVKKTPHEQYGQRIASAGLRETAMGSLWFREAEQSLKVPLNISLPYNETGYFAAERPKAAGFRFPVKRGQKLFIALDKKPVTQFSVYLDLWEFSETDPAKSRLLAAADTTGNPVEYDVKNDASYIIRLQPELLKSGEYSLSITTGPSLAFPIPDKVKSNIGSLWGAGRDGGARKHEGIDIFAAFRSPVVACADGIVAQVNENNLGGKVVFLRLRNRDITLYYAHLDSQLVQSGQFVKTGDTLGLVGNTGNAKYTAPHLHFGIYAVGGAIDPINFVNPVTKTAGKISASLANLDKEVRNKGKTNKLYSGPDAGPATFTLLEQNTLLRVEAATGNQYKVSLPDGQKGYVGSGAINSITDPLHRMKLTKNTALLDAPDSLAARKTILDAGMSISVLANFRKFFFVSAGDGQNGWIDKNML